MNDPVKMPSGKAPTGNPILREIRFKREQLESQILAGIPVDYPAYRSAIGAYHTLRTLEAFTEETLKKGDYVDDD